MKRKFLGISSNHSTGSELLKLRAIFVRRFWREVINDARDDRSRGSGVASDGSQLVKGVAVQLDLLRLAQVERGRESLNQNSLLVVEPEAVPRRGSVLRFKPDNAESDVR